jgi:hypothetical protein
MFMTTLFTLPTNMKISNHYITVLKPALKDCFLPHPFYTTELFSTESSWWAIIKFWNKYFATYWSIVCHILIRWLNNCTNYILHICIVLNTIFLLSPHQAEELYNIEIYNHWALHDSCGTQNGNNTLCITFTLWNVLHLSYIYIYIY